MTADLFIPERSVLVHRGEHHTFPHGAAAHRCIADIADDNALLPVHAFEQCRADRYIARTADDGVIGHGAERREERMHRPAKAFVKTRRTREHFRKRAVDDEILRKLADAAGMTFLNDGKRCAAEESLHDLHERCIIKLYRR